MCLVYIIKTPIVCQNELSLYTVLPPPVHDSTNNLYIYIEPGVEYLAIGYTKECYTKYNRKKLINCKRTNDSVLYPQNQLTLQHKKKN